MHSDRTEGSRAWRSPQIEIGATISTQVVILAAGLGTRLGRPLPKPLTRLANGRSIIENQVEIIRAALGPDTEITVVVGFKLEHILETVPDVSFVYNEDYDRTNTSKSLLKALRLTGSRAVLWMNGDVVFDPSVLCRVAPTIEADRSFVCVDTASVGDEEIKYTLGANGTIEQLSKRVERGLGEAVGINFVSSNDKDALISRLQEVDDSDYFERAIELCIEHDDVEFIATDISDLFAVEIDFEQDLDLANEHL